MYFIDRKEYTGPIYEQIENTYNFVLQHINIGAKIEGLYRKDIPEIPAEAIRELIVNAVMHRNYLSHSYIQVCIYDDRLEITSPGGLYGGLTIEQVLNGSSSIRNELIADIFLKMGIVEKWGTGIKRIRDLCKEHGLGEVLYSADDFSFTATIMRTRKNLFEPIAENVSKTSLQFPNNDRINDRINLSESEKQIFSEIEKNPFVKTEEIVFLTGFSMPTVNRAIKSLREKGIINREGSKKSGHWLVLAKNQENDK